MQICHFLFPSSSCLPTEVPIKYFIGPPYTKYLQSDLLAAIEHMTIFSSKTVLL